MSETFLSRWSRRKQAASEQVEPPQEAASPEEIAAGNKVEAPAAPDEASPPDPPAFDPKSLPAVDEITADTDIRGFLAAGVPPDLARAALRRAWVSDPRIRDFVGLADYDWDFNAPEAMAGFGPIEPADALRREVIRLLDRAEAPVEHPKALSNDVSGSPGEESHEAIPTPAPPRGSGGPVLATKHWVPASAGTSGPSDSTSAPPDSEQLQNAAQFPDEPAGSPTAPDNPERPGSTQRVGPQRHGTALPRSGV
jgi:hypothetical protein